MTSALVAFALAFRCVLLTMVVSSCTSIAPSNWDDDLVQRNSALAMGLKLKDEQAGIPWPEGSRHAAAAEQYGNFQAIWNSDVRVLAFWAGVSSGVAASFVEPVPFDTVRDEWETRRMVTSDAYLELKRRFEALTFETAGTGEIIKGLNILKQILEGYDALEGYLTTRKQKKLLLNLQAAMLPRFDELRASNLPKRRSLTE